MFNPFPSMRRAAFGTTVAALLAWAVPTASQAAVVFSDNFNAGPLAAWGNERGNWVGVSGGYNAGAPNNIPPTYSSVTTLPGLTNFTVELDVLDLRDGGVWLRSSFNGGNINGVLLVTGGGGSGNNGLYWHTVSNGVFSGVQGLTGNLGLADQDTHLRIEVSGDTYSVFVNNNPVAATTLNTNLFASGSVGLYDFSTQSFDNVVISTPDQRIPEPATLALLGPGLLGLAAVRRRRQV